MTEKTVRRDQENIYLDKHSAPPLHNQRREIRLLEDRALQEAQHPNYQSNAFYLKPYTQNSQTKDHSTPSNNLANHDKTNGNINKPPQKTSDNELRQILKESASPTAAVGTHDISYRIVNEILNTQEGDRNQLKAKTNSRIADRRKSPLMGAQTSALDNLVDTPKEGKQMFEENEELRRLENGIREMKRQLEKKREMVENGRNQFEVETVAISEREKQLKEEHVSVKQRIEQRATVKSQPKERPNLNPVKEKLRGLKPEMQHYEKEIAKLKYHIDKQERDWAGIEESVMQEYRKQIQEFEEAIMSIEEQKMSIYAKLSEATHIHNQDLEQKAMLKEDLSSRLLQRANLVAQREEIEQALETFRVNNKVEMDFYFMEIQIKQQVAALETEIQGLYSKVGQARKLSGEVGGIKSNKRRGVDLEQIVNGWNDLCNFEVKLSMSAEEIGLVGLEGAYVEVLSRYGVEVEENRVWEYMQGNLEEGSKEEIVEGIKQRMVIREEGLEVWGNQMSEQMKEIGEKEEEREFLRLYEEFWEMIHSYGMTLGMGNEEEEGENGELERIEREIREKEEMREELERKLSDRREEIENESLREAEIAFQAYVEQHASTFEAIESENGPEAAEEMKQQHHQEFIQLAQGSLQDHLDHVQELKDEVKRLEQTIQSNTDNVDLKILPLLQDLLPTIEEGTVLISALKQQQLLLLETEDEVTGQLNYVLESRNDKLQQLHQKFVDSLPHGLAELKEAKEMLESRYGVLHEEASQLENEIIEADKSATEEILGERRLQKELKDIENEFSHIEAIRKPKLHELDMQVGVWDREIKELEKILEHLQMQRLGLEQQFIEQNYLVDEASYHSHTPAAGMNERPSKALESTERYTSNRGKDKENRNQLIKGLKNKGIQGLAEIGGSTPGNFDLSPIERSHSPKSRDNKQNKEALGYINSSLYPESSAGKDGVGNWNCLSPPSSALLGSNKRKTKASAGKEKSRERHDDGKKEETTYLKNYQKRLEQKQHALANRQRELPRSSTSVSLDTRTRSLPQTAIPNFSYNPVSKRIEDAGFFTQHTSPKVHDAFSRPPSAYQSAQNVQKNFFSKDLEDSGRTGLLEDGTSVFSPKELTLNINSLKAQLNMPYSMKSVPYEELRYKELVGRNGELPGEDLAREFGMGEGSSHEGVVGRPSNVRRLNQNVMHGMMGVVRKEEGEDSNRSKSTGINAGRFNARAGDYMSEKLSHREREEKSQGRPDLFTGRNLGFVRSFGSPLGKIERNFDPREGVHDMKGRTVANDGGVHDVLFFETIKPLLQGSLVYKKFTSYQSLKRAEFDPLMGDLYPPEVCGYGVRSLKLNPSLDKIEVKHTAKQSVEVTIPVESILRAVVPQITMDILRVQKKIVESQHMSAHHLEDKISIADIFGDVSTKALLAKRGVNNLNNGMERYLNCSYYSFSILLEKGGKVEFVTSRYNVFKEWIHGINMLLKHKKQLAKLRYKLEKM